MQIHTTARHCELDPEIRLFAHQRLEKLGRFATDIHEARLIVTAEGYRHSAEITVRLNQQELVSRQASNEPRIAIDLAADRLERQLRRFKEKRVQRKRGPRGGVRELGASNGAEPADDGRAGED